MVKLSKNAVQITQIESSTSNLVDDPSESKIQARYILTWLLFLGSVIIYALRVNLNITIVAMIKQPNTTLNYFDKYNDTSSGSIDTCIDENVNRNATFNLNYNETEEIPLGRRGTFEWGQAEQGTILGGFYYGYLSTQMVGGRLAHRFGPKIVYTGGILVSSLLTLLTPLAANWHVAALVTLRILVGVFQGVSFPAIYSFVPYWYTTRELSTHLAIILTGNHVGTIVAMPIAGYLCDHGFAGGWPSVYYLFGAVGFLFCIFLFVFVEDKPEDHPWISQKELLLLKDGRSSQSNQKNPPVPWKQILFSVPVYALATAKMTSSYAYHVVLTRIPAYLDGVLNFSVEANGVINAVLYICKSISGVIAGFLADMILKKTSLTTDPVRKIFESIALIGMGVLMMVIPSIGCDTTVVITILCVALFTSGFNCGGDYPAPTDMAPAYSGTIFGIINTFAATTGVLAPLAVGLILQENDQSLTQWSYVFYSSGGICAGGIVFFLLFGSSKLQPWGEPPPETTKTDSKEPKIEIDLKSVQ